MPRTREDQSLGQLGQLNYESISQQTWKDERSTDQFRYRSTTLSRNIADKQVAWAITILKCLGIVKTQGKVGVVILFLFASLMWVPPIFLSICVKNSGFLMASPSGLPTILLFTGITLSYHFGAFYGLKHIRKLKLNLQIAFRQGNLMRNSLILVGIFAILHCAYLSIVLYLYIAQPFDFPWLPFSLIYLLGYGYCSFVGIAMNIVFGAICTAIRVRIFALRERFDDWSHGLKEALSEYTELCENMQEQVEAIKWWVLCNIVSFLTVWVIDFHLWQIIASQSNTGNAFGHLVFYNCTAHGVIPRSDFEIPVKLLTGCEVLFSTLVFFHFTSPLYWAAMVSVECNSFREHVNKLNIEEDDKPLGRFSITTLEFFISRVQMASYFAFKLFGINITRVIYSITGLMTTIQIVLSVMANKLLSG